MPLPTLEELREIINSYDKAPSESEASRLSKLPRSEFARIGVTLKISRAAVEPLSFFFTRYANKKNFVKSKCSRKNLRRLGMDLDLATSLMFNNKEIIDFYRTAGTIIDSSILRHGRVLDRFAPLKNCWCRMERLYDFYELHSGRSIGFSDSRHLHIVLLKTDMVHVYKFMKRRGTD